MKRFWIFWCVAAVLITGACSVEPSIGNEVGDFSENISLVSWNVQTFFNAEFDGSEYSNFCDSSKWNREKYSVRLERLCNALVELDADVYVLEEIENESVIYDICNQLSGKSWTAGNKWNYSCFAKEENSAIGCAVLSKYELRDMTVHCVDVRTEKEKQPILRYLIEVSVLVKDKSLTILANHWKSKVDGQEDSEVWRQFQEALLVQRLLELKSRNSSVVICGDFNKDIGEFNLDESEDGSKVLLNGKSLKCTDSVSVLCSWLGQTGDDYVNCGSYYFKGNWEKIDSFFIYGNCVLLKFEPFVNSLWCDSEGYPNGYKVYSGEGVSDHLPVKAYLRF